jgi:large subunit ribosomal protein L31
MRGGFARGRSLTDGSGRDGCARETMKQEIHPEYKSTKVTCACGNSWETRSTQEEIRLDVCSACHPFFTGQQKFINRGGRVEKFKNKYNLD